MTVIPINLGFVNAFLVKGDKHTILVDCGFPGDEKKILHAMEQNNIPSGSVSLIVITHTDPDHYGSCGPLKEILKASVVVHSADADRIPAGLIRQMRPSRPLGYLMKYMASTVSILRMKRYVPFHPDIIMQDSTLPLQQYGIQGYLLHTPGETSGSISVVLDDGAIIAGDLLGGTYPGSGVPAYSLFYEDKRVAKESIKVILALKPRIIYTGHSSPLDVAKYAHKLESLTM